MDGNYNMKLTQSKLKALILETMEGEEESEVLPEEEKKELVQIVLSQLLDTSSPEIFEQMKELLESSGVPLEQVGNYMDPQAIADKIMNIVDNNLDEDLRVLFGMLEEFNFPLENLRGFINLEDIKETLAAVDHENVKDGTYSSYVAMIDLLVNLGTAYGEDLTDLGGTLGPSLAAYMNNLISSASPNSTPPSAHRTKWAPLLVTVRGNYNQDWLFTSWLRNKSLLTDEELTKLYQSASPVTQAKMEKSKKLAEFPGVSKAIADRLALKKSGSSRLRMSLRRKRKK